MDLSTTSLPSLNDTNHSLALPSLNQAHHFISLNSPILIISIGKLK